MSKTNCLNRFSETWGKDIALLGLRLFVAYEFWEAGVEKWNGSNWFDSIQQDFPFPFNLLPVDVSWAAAMGTELVAPVLLVLGLFGRWGALALMAVTGGCMDCRSRRQRLQRLRQRL